MLGSKHKSLRARLAGSRRLGIEQLEDRRMLAVITVTSPFDTTTPEGDVTLREAILAANTDASVDGSAAGNGPDRIVFDPSLDGAVIQVFSEFEITESLIIDASALPQGITLNARSDNRLLNYTHAFGNLTLNQIALTNARTMGSNPLGGGSDNSGAGIRFLSVGTLTLRDSTVKDSGTTGLRADGGGIYSDAGSVVLIDSTVSGNFTESAGAEGGGIFTQSGAVTLTNSTLSGNRTEGANAEGGGLFTGSGEVTLNHSTVTNNSTIGMNSDGGGIFVSNTATNPAFTVQNSIIGGNSVGAGSIIPDVLADPNVVPNIDYSLIGNTLGTGINPVTGTGNVLDVDPMLDVLAGNGGLTETNAPLPGSPVINSGDPSFVLASLPNDQRGVGYTREFAGRIDMGALEAQTLALVVDNLGDTSDGDYSTGNLTLREAVEVANANPNPGIVDDTILFSVLLSGDTILLEEELLVTDSVTINAATLPLGLTVDAQHTSRLFNVHDGEEATITADLNLNGLTLTRGQTTLLDLPITLPAGGGGIRFVSTGTLTLTDTVLSDSRTDGSSLDGGAIMTESGNVTLIRSTLSGSQTSGAGARGGAIATYEGVVTLIDSTLSGSTTSGMFAEGGGIYTFSGDINLTRSTVSDNHTLDEGGGGGIHSSSGTVTIVDSTLSGNSTVGDAARGGGINTTTGTINITGSTLRANHTTGENASGGGIYSTSGDITVTDSTIDGNYTTGYVSSGGGIHAFIGDLTITRSTVSNNYTLGNFGSGGGLFARSDFAMTDSTVSGNRTEGMNARGGGVHASDRVVIDGSTIANNSTTGTGSEGGGLLVSTAANTFFSLQNSIVANNTVANSTAPDIRPDTGGSTLDIDFTLIGDTSGSIITAAMGNNNLLNVDPLLGPLIYLGGPTQTHALLAGSPAIDAGVSVRLTDQRGLPAPVDLAGVVNAVGSDGSDIGAYERQETLMGDFDSDDDVDGTDFLVWQRGFPGTFDASDLADWQANYGNATPALQATTSTPSPLAATLVFWDSLVDAEETSAAPLAVNAAEATRAAFTPHDQALATFAAEFEEDRRLAREKTDAEYDWLTSLDDQSSHVSSLTHPRKEF